MVKIEKQRAVTIISSLLADWHKGGNRIGLIAKMHIPMRGFEMLSLSLQLVNILFKNQQHGYNIGEEV
jgi:hypothetical protein